MLIFAIDPGNVQSGYALIEMPDFKCVAFGKIDNFDLLERVKTLPRGVVVAIEMVACYGMPVGKDVFDTCVWIGRFTQALNLYKVNYIYRTEEKMELCGNMKAKDANIRQSLINRYAKFDYKTGKGTKKNPDTFYGVSKDAWQAIAVAVTYYEKENNND